MRPRAAIVGNTLLLLVAAIYGCVMALPSLFVRAPKLRAPKPIQHDYHAIAARHERRALRTEYVGGMIIGALYGICAGFLLCLWVVS